MNKKNIVLFGMFFGALLCVDIACAGALDPRNSDNPEERVRNRRRRMLQLDYMLKELTDKQRQDLEELGRPIVEPAEAYKNEEGLADWPWYDKTLERHELQEAIEQGQQRAIAVTSINRTMRNLPVTEQIKMMAYDGVKAGVEDALAKETSHLVSKVIEGAKTIFKSSEQRDQEKKVAEFSAQGEKLLLLQGRMKKVVMEQEMLKFISKNGIKTSDDSIDLLPSQARALEEKENERNELLAASMKELEDAFDQYQADMKKLREEKDAKK